MFNFVMCNLYYDYADVKPQWFEKIRNINDRNANLFHSNIIKSVYERKYLNKLNKMKIVRILILTLKASIHISPLSLGYLSMIFGLSIIISEWATDRMLHLQHLFFDDLIKSKKTIESLTQIVSQYQILADQSSAFHVIGILMTISGLILCIVGILFLIFNMKNVEKYYRAIGSLVIDISDNSLFIIFSAFFAISLIFVSVASQIAMDNRQMFFQIIVDVIQENRTVDNIKPLLDKLLSQNSFEFALNIFHSGFFAMLSLTFLIILLLRRTRKDILIILSDDLVFYGLISFVLWFFLYIAIVGITNPPQIPNVELPSQFQK